MSESSSVSGSPLHRGELDMVADMEVDMVAAMVADKKKRKIVAEKRKRTKPADMEWSWTWWPTLRQKR